MAKVVKAALIGGLALTVLAWLATVPGRSSTAAYRAQALQADEYPAGYHARQPLLW